MPELRDTMISPEFSIQHGFDSFVKTQFADCSTIDEFVAAFNEYFPAEKSYLDEVDFRLDPGYVQRERKVSCEGSALMFEAFVRQTFPGQYTVIFLMDNHSTKGHVVAVLVPNDQLADNEDAGEWLQNKITAHETSDILAYDFNKKSSLKRFVMGSAATFPLMIRSVPELINDRQKAYKISKMVDV